MANQPTSRTVQPPPDLPNLPEASSSLSNYLRNFALWARHGFADKLSGSVAQPGLMLAGYDAPAGVNPSIYMLEVSQAGVAALAPMALGGGDMGAPVPIASRKGVTNGSNAAAGDIGEVISAINTTGASFPSATTQNIVSIPLTPGDWDVAGEFWFTGGTAGISAIAAGITSVSGVLPNLALNTSRVHVQGTLSGPQVMALRPCRVNVTVTTAYFLVGYIIYTTGPANGTGAIWARRAR